MNIEENGKIGEELDEKIKNVGKTFNVLKNRFLGKKETSREIKIKLVKQVDSNNYLTDASTFTKETNYHQ